MGDEAEDLEEKAWSDQGEKDFKQENKCNYNYPGCTGEDNFIWENVHSGSTFPCCENCFNIRQKKEGEINEKYMNIKPFSGQNEYGEYYDEDSY